MEQLKDQGTTVKMSANIIRRELNVLEDILAELKSINSKLQYTTPQQPANPAPYYVIKPTSLSSSLSDTTVKND